MYLALTESMFFLNNLVSIGSCRLNKLFPDCPAVVPHGLLLSAGITPRIPPDKIVVTVPGKEALLSQVIPAPPPPPGPILPAPATESKIARSAPFPPATFNCAGVI